MTDLTAAVVNAGGDPLSLHLLDRDTPDLLRYSTLTSARRNGHENLRIVDAVYEWQGSPLVFLVDGESVASEEQLQCARRLLAMRGDAPYLGVVEPSHLRVYRNALDKKSLRQASVLRGNSEIAQQALFQHLGNLRPEVFINQSWISNVVLNLLSRSTTTLVRLGCSDTDAISLVGRAFFTRFLADRELLPEKMSDPNTTAQLFDTSEKAIETSAWLDETFNGDLLPLATRRLESLPKAGLHELGNILRRAPDSQLFLEWEEEWANLNFAHIPVGVLSQAYELYLRDHEPVRQRREGGYFTPRPIAELMVNASFRALQNDNRAITAKVLDPAVGGGIFLLTAYRELVKERWRADEVRPSTEILREILYNQLVGFDINEAALRFTALGLYLMAIELDPDPEPVDKLRFEDLRGSVLHRVRSGDNDYANELGSLGPLVSDEHVNQYDLVIGNPPWASRTNLPDWNYVRNSVSKIASDRGVTKEPPPLPNHCLDLPFVWRAMEWAKPSGQIAFALHARLLFQQGNNMPSARQSLFKALNITSIINGAELRKTKVWPQVTAPFCILFANNRVPEASAGFRFVSPRFEESLNSAGEMRVEALNAEVVSRQNIERTPELLKILYRGSMADLGVLERLRSKGVPTLEEVWRKSIGSTPQGSLLGSGQGFQTIRPNSPSRRDGEQGAAGGYLRGKPMVSTDSFSDFYINTKSLNILDLDRLDWQRSRDLFVGPLVLVHKSPPALSGRIRVSISDKDVVFNESFYGYSCASHPDAQLLARYIALILGSRLSIWLALLTSGEFGSEKNVIEKATIDRFPIPEFDELTVSQRRDIAKLADGVHNRKMLWDDVDEWVAKLYGLSEHDSQVISDTLEFHLPYDENKSRAQEVPAPPDIERFCVELQDELNPWGESNGVSLYIEPTHDCRSQPWQTIYVKTSDGHANSSDLEASYAELLRTAHETAASQILVRAEPRILLIGQLAQKRYWSVTRARLLAQRIVWSHSELFERQRNG